MPYFGTTFAWYSSEVIKSAIDAFDSGFKMTNQPSPMGSFCKSSGLSITLSLIDTISPEKGR